MTTQYLKAYCVAANEWYAATSDSEALDVAAQLHRKDPAQFGKRKQAVRLETNLDMVVIDDDTGLKTSLGQLLARAKQPGFICCVL
jgi:hypothetical protein